MKTLGIPITLDRPRTLLIDEAAFALIQQRYGVNLAEVMRQDIDGFTFTLDITRACLFAGCVAEDSRLTPNHVSRVVTHENFECFHEPIVKAIMRGLGIAYQP